MSRNANYELLESVSAWEPAPSDSMGGTCGNIQYHVNGEYDFDSRKYKGGILGGKSLYDAVQAPYLLARLMAGFTGLQVSANGQEAYKTTWDTAIKHKRTGAIVTFYDWKGAASIGSCDKALSLVKTDKGFKADLKALVRALTDERFPHPYDGCTVGEIA